MKKIACKFGGSSLADSDQIKKAVEIIKSDKSRKYIVLSAPGKRNKDDIKITDLLLSCYELSKLNADISEPFGRIEERFRTIVDDLDIRMNIVPVLGQIRKKITSGATKDYIASRGEYLTGLVFSKYLDCEFIEPDRHIILHSNGRLYPESYDNLAKVLKDESKLYIIPGFYGRDADGKIKTFSRGGSDITGAIVARAVHADLYENWTDVSGFLMADPGIVDNPKSIKEITYMELRELAYMGAGVLHDEAIFPVRELSIPINIRNTNSPDDSGTMIVKNRNTDESVIIGIAGRKNFTMISMEKTLMNREQGFGRKLLNIIERHNISYEHTPTGIDTISIVIKDEELKDRTDDILKEIQEILHVDRVEVERELALIATVGCGMAHKMGVAATLFRAVADAGINVHIIDQGSSEINIIIGIKSSDFENAVRAIYAAFVKGD